MDRAVDLDDEPHLVTAEIGDEALDRELSAKLEPQESAGSQSLPEELLRGRLALPQLASPLRLGRAMGEGAGG